MSFCTAITCIDGRVQLPVIGYLKQRFNVDYVDIVSEPGPNRILGKAAQSSLSELIFQRVKISVERHGSVGIAVVGHHDCAGNPWDKDEQDADTRAAMACVSKRFPHLPVIGLWVDEHWEVSEIVGE